VPRASKSEPFTIEIRRVFPDALVVLAGEVDASNVAELYEQFSELIRDGMQRISLHLAEVTFMDSTGLSVLVALQKRTQALGGEFVIFSPSPQLRRLFALASLDSYFTIRPVDRSCQGDAPPSPTSTPRDEERTTARTTRLTPGD
jgi:anti-sigma B factor antagonist